MGTPPERDNVDDDNDDDAHRSVDAMAVAAATAARRPSAAGIAEATIEPVASMVSVAVTRSTRRGE